MKRNCQVYKLFYKNFSNILSGRIVETGLPHDFAEYRTLLFYRVLMNMIIHNTCIAILLRLGIY